jgi:aspartate aminotransferase
MSETLKTAEIAALAKDPGTSKAPRFGAMADGLRGSEILRIANEIRVLSGSGKKLCDLTVGDFSPREFPIPDKLKTALAAAIARGETNYPSTPGMPALREAVLAFYRRELGLDYPLESVLITSGSRPGIYGSFRTLVDPGDKVVYPAPSWNNNHYTHLVGGSGAPVMCRAADSFMPSREAVRAAMRGARLLCLCSPQNPTGTVFARDVLLGICEDVLAENESRERWGERPLYLLYDQVYWTLTFGAARHFTPPGLVPEMARYTVLVDGISKAFAATGLRVGWVVGSTDIVAKMTALLGHVGTWAPRPEQLATAELLQDAAAVAAFQDVFKRGVQQRLQALSQGLQQMKHEGLPVDCLAPAGAIYLTARIAPFGRRTPDGATLENTEDVRRYLLTAAGIAAVPFNAFAMKDDDGWFRLSVGAVSLQDAQDAIPRLSTALRALA